MIIYHVDLQKFLRRPKEGAKHLMTCCCYIGTHAFSASDTHFLLLKFRGHKTILILAVVPTDENDFLRKKYNTMLKLLWFYFVKLVLRDDI